MKRLILNINVASPPADWQDHVLVLWTEDDATRQDPSAEHLPDAWERHTQQAWTQRAGVVATWDGGDTAYDLYPWGWVVIRSFDGDSIGRLVTTRTGSLDLVLNPMFEDAYKTWNMSREETIRDVVERHLRRFGFS